MAAYLSPVFGAGAQLFNNQGIVLSGGKIWTYQAGTTTPYTTWTDSTQLVANANPIILDSAGRPSNEIWLQASSTYKLILTDSNNNVLGTWDNIAGLNDITSSVVAAEWSATNLTPAYISGTSFSVSGNNTATFVINRRVKIAVSAGTIYGYVYSSSFGGGITTVVIQPDSGVLDSGISSVNVGLLSSTNPSVPQQYLATNAAVSVASAATTPIGVALSANVTITGTVTITAFDTVLAGIIKIVKFTDALLLTHNATNLILPGGINITTSNGDQAIFRSLGSGNWECVSYLDSAVGIKASQVINFLYSVSCTQGSGALTCGLQPCGIQFRNATITSGTPVTKYVSSALSLVVPSGATLGAVSTVSATLVLCAIDAPSAVELAIINIAGGNLDESALISTTAITAGSTSNNVFYSTSARSNVTFKVIGSINAVNTAGAWASPSLVRGAGGNTTIAQENDCQIFTASGTWTKPLWVASNQTIKVEMWGGGGGGSAGGGGGGGAYATRIFKASELGATEPVVVGAGGALATVGGDSSFSSSANLITAYGGGGASASFGGGGGGGDYSAGANGSGGNGGAGGAGYSSGGVATPAATSATGSAGAGGSSTGGAAYHAFMGGGGGVNGSGAGRGGFSVFGGGGGGTNASGGGLSHYGGDGGTGAVAASIPGGGGGTNGSTTGTVGARGEVRVYIF